MRDPAGRDGRHASGEPDARSRIAEHPGPVREYALDTGELLHQSAGDAQESRVELALALLGRMGRTDAAPLMAEIAREGSDHLRWQALRECIALDTATGFAALKAIAADPADSLGAPARCPARAALRGASGACHIGARLMPRQIEILDPRSCTLEECVGALRGKRLRSAFRRKPASRGRLAAAAGQQPELPRRPAGRTAEAAAPRCGRRERLRPAGGDALARAGQFLPARQYLALAQRAQLPGQRRRASFTSCRTTIISISSRSAISGRATGAITGSSITRRSMAGAASLPGCASSNARGSRKAGCSTTAPIATSTASSRPMRCRSRST